MAAAAAVRGTGVRPFAGPVFEDPASVVVCLDGPGPMTFAITELTPSRSVRIVTVRALDADGLTVLGIRLTRSSGTTGMGTVKGYPPAAPGYSWDRTQPADGAVVEAGQRYELVVGLDLTAGDVGSIRGLSVEYEDDGPRRTLVVPHVLALTSAATTCSDHEGYLDEVAGTG